MFATLQLFLALGFGRSALVADLVLTAAAAGATTVVVARARRRRPPTGAPAEDPATDVVAEAEVVVSGAGHHQPA